MPTFLGLPLFSSPVQALVEVLLPDFPAPKSRRPRAFPRRPSARVHHSSRASVNPKHLLPRPKSVRQPLDRRPRLYLALVLDGAALSQILRFFAMVPEVLSRLVDLPDQ